MPAIRKCRVRGCVNSSSSHKMFGFPQERQLAKKWKENMGLTLLDDLPRTNAYLCDVHFEKEAVGTKLLRKDAVPTLHMDFCQQYG
ncbi:PREDICTED: uncharacterized protein LOC108365438 [Rhagoletis zephyria]|uniref:uncharacterized protein LOC108365438 n=1 Tax=Rhagoletis zephyria TaxID=28612 RepID=UPI0008112A8E|nr:PREDICTED: uncharacterized protein LOC108365438 [Rhagoletis zephyria]